MPNAQTELRLGLIVNPIAGMGGKVGLKGTDGAATLAEARRRGAVPIAGMRARRALARMGALGNVRLITGVGDLGETVAGDLGMEAVPVGAAPRSVAEDTRTAAAAMVASGVDLILFAGGDGTARDIFEVVGDRTPMLGVPTGVKMHSAVFATTPENAGEVTRRFLTADREQRRLRRAEVMDLDGDREDRVSARLYGYAQVPYERARVQHAKAGAHVDDEAALDALCRAIAATLEPGCVHIFGPGTTTQRILRHAGIDGTLLGVDAVADGRLVGSDLGEGAILSLTEGMPTRIVAGVIGGQGFLFGRGNQQISPEVIRRAGRDRVTVVSSLAKILALEDGCLFVDTGDSELDAALAGFIRVQTAPDQAVLCKVAT
ncbi:MAG: ATP-NAD kinase family protein [Rhizobiaceae bacterium]|nr:ATP-NAD kinase family protein [Rhizobiaceae bacterium]